MLPQKEEQFSNPLSLMNHRMQSCAILSPQVALSFAVDAIFLKKWN